MKNPASAPVHLMVKLREYASKLDKNVGVHERAEPSQLTNMQCSTYLVTLCIHSTQQLTFGLYLLLKELRHGPRVLKELANFFKSVACDLSKSF